MSQPFWELGLNNGIHRIAGASRYLNEFKSMHVTGKLNAFILDESYHLLTNREYFYRSLWFNCAFGDYFGGNADAVDDCLRDYNLSNLASSAFYFLSLHEELLIKDIGREYEFFKQSFELAAKAWEQEGVTFVYVISE